MIPYGKQQIDAADIEAVTQVLQSTWLTQGPKVPEFEQAVRTFCQANHAVAVNSATSALHIACLALAVGPGDWVWTSPNSFVASANCALYCGARVDFVDIELATGNMCVAALEAKLLLAEQQHTLPKVVIPVHFAGQPCDMQKIAALAQRFGFRIIEDASHAIGATYQGTPIGACQYSDICVFSFHPVKIITSAEGGMALTNNPTLARKMQLLRSHGITSDEQEYTEESHGPWYYQQQVLGFNYRMTDLQAALGLSQFSKLQSFVAERHTLAQYYDNAIAQLPGIIPLVQTANNYSSYHLYVVRLTGLTAAQHKHCVIYLREHGIIGHVHYIPIYLQPFYQKMGFNADVFPNAALYYSQAITLPLYPGLTSAQQDFIIESLRQFLKLPSGLLGA